MIKERDRRHGLYLEWLGAKPVTKPAAKKTPKAASKKSEEK